MLAALNYWRARHCVPQFCSLQRSPTAAITSSFVVTETHQNGGLGVVPLDKCQILWELSLSAFVMRGRRPLAVHTAPITSLEHCPRKCKTSGAATYLPSSMKSLPIKRLITDWRMPPRREGHSCTRSRGLAPSLARKCKHFLPSLASD